MKELVKLAWRNIGRQRGRTILSLMAILSGVFVVIFAKGFIDGMLDNVLNLNINFNSGHVRIIRPEYQVKERLLSLGYPVGESGKTYRQLTRDLQGLPGVKQATGRIRFGMMLARGEERQAVTGIGADLPAEERLTGLSRYLTGAGAGRLPRPGRKEILLGAELMKKLNLKVGDKVNAVFSTSFGGFRVVTFGVAGRMMSGVKYLDEGVAYLPLAEAMPLVEFEDAVTEIVVFGRDPARAGELQRSIAAYLGKEKSDLKAIPWDQSSEMVIQLIRMRVIYNAIYVMIALLASFVVFNTLMMIVAERTREIGMLAALGLTPAAIKRLFLLEGALLAGLGSAAGAILGGVCNFILSRVGIDFSQVMKGIGKDFMMSPKLYSNFRFEDLGFGMAIGIAVTVLAAYLPARRASRMDPTEALRTL
jgi:putative ABC transport system permease protein